MYLKLFLSFAYIGMFTFGGGYAMLPMFERELVEKRKWLLKDDIADMFATAQCLPGIIASNTAVFVGYRQKGILGGIVASLGVVTPSILIILLIAAFLTNLTDIDLVNKAFVGVRVCVCVLILNVVIKLWKQSIADKTAIVIFTVIFFISVLTDLPIALLIISSGLIGISISSFRNRYKKEKLK